MESELTTQIMQISHGITIIDLPPEMFLHIFDYLSTRDILSLFKTCKVLWLLLPRWKKYLAERKYKELCHSKKTQKRIAKWAIYQNNKTILNKAFSKLTFRRNGTLFLSRKLVLKLIKYASSKRSLSCTKFIYDVLYPPTKREKAVAGYFHPRMVPDNLPPQHALGLRLNWLFCPCPRDDMFIECYHLTMYDKMKVKDARLALGIRGQKTE